MLEKRVRKKEREYYRNVYRKKNQSEEKEVTRIKLRLMNGKTKLKKR